MRPIILIGNLFYLLSKAGRYLAFLFGSVERVQERQFRKYLNALAGTALGDRFDIRPDMSYSEFANNFPITDYRDYKPYVHSLMNGEQDVLTHDAIRRLVPTSGTTDPTKLIPYTDRLKTEFTKAIDVWLTDLYLHYPAVMAGSQFWILTPTAELEPIDSEVPVGFEPDKEYFGKWEKYVIEQLMVLPQALHEVKDRKNYFHLLCYHLLRRSDLRLISVWNPSILLVIHTYLIAHFDALVRDIAEGHIHLPSKLVANDLRIASEITSKADPARAQRLSALSKEERLHARHLWKNLQVISCWCSGTSQAFLAELNTYFKGVVFQEKGVLATEGVVTIPFAGRRKRLLAYTSHFYEFLCSETGDIFRAHQLENGRTYEVLITTGGGLYRYPLYDRMRCTGHYRGIPRLEFEGKSNVISDLTGEKLSEITVAGTLKTARELFGLAGKYMFLAGWSHEQGSGYQLILLEEDVAGWSEAKRDRMLDFIDTGLRQNYHYDNSRLMNQLDPVGLFPIPLELSNTYVEHKYEGRQISTVKFLSLETDTGILSWLKNEYSMKHHEKTTHITA